MVSSSSESMSTFSMHRHDEGAAAFDDAEAAFSHRAIRLHDLMLAAGNDQHLVRADLRVTARPDDDEDEKDKQQRARGQMTVIQGMPPAPQAWESGSWVLIN